jgi:citrate synthase
MKQYKEENDSALTASGSNKAYNRQNRFEPMVYRLWNGSWLDERLIQSFTRELGASALEKTRDHDAITMLAEYFQPREYMKMLESPIFRFALTNGDGSKSKKDEYEDRIERLASITAFVIAVYRVHTLEKVVHPRIGRSFANNTLFMLHRESPNSMEELALDTLLCAYVQVRDRQLPNIMLDSMRLISTFIFHWRKRREDRRFEEILHLLVMETEGAQPRSLTSNIGFTNIYDYRCAILDHFAFEIGKQRNELTLYKTAKRLELQYTKKGLYPHIDFYAALLMHNLRIPTELFAPIVCLGKISGWLGQRMTTRDYPL